jgi:hypothetical protein
LVSALDGSAFVTRYSFTTFQGRKPTLSTPG